VDFVHLDDMFVMLAAGGQPARTGKIGKLGRWPGNVLSQPVFNQRASV